jgi:hypothetical protein
MHLMNKVYISVRKKYGFWSFLWDCIMVCLTCGFWLIYIYVREKREQ